MARLKGLLGNGVGGFYWLLHLSERVSVSPSGEEITVVHVGCCGVSISLVLPERMIFIGVSHCI